MRIKFTSETEVNSIRDFRTIEFEDNGLIFEQCLEMALTYLYPETKEKKLIDKP